MPAPKPSHCSACGGSSIGDRPLVGHDPYGSNSGKFDVYPCDDCGSGTTAPYVAPEDLGSLYAGAYDSYADPDLPGPFGKVFAFYHWLTRRLYQRDLPARGVADRSGDLLEVGCGDGQAGESFIEEGWRAYAVEPSPIAADTARGRGIDVFEGTLDSYDPDGRKFDAVLFRHSLEHVVEPRTDLARAADLLAPGGKLLVEVPNYGCWQVRSFGADWYGLSLPVHRTHFTARGLRSAVESAGLRVEDLGTGTCPSALPASVQFKLFGRNVLHAPGAAGIVIWRAAQLLLYPLSSTIDRVRGGGDVLRVVAVKDA